MSGPVRRVLVAHPFPDRYGADRMLVAALRSLVDDGVQVSVRVPETGPLLETLREQGLDFEVTSFPVLRKALLRPAPLARVAAGTPRDVTRLVRAIRQARPDVVYVNTLTLPHWLAAARLAGVPSVCHVREAEDLLPAAVQRALVTPLRLATVVVANSQRTRDWLVGNVGALRERVRVLHNGFDFGSVVPLRPRDGRLRLVLVGRLNARKGPDAAIDALAQLVHAGYDAELEIVGGTFRGYEWYPGELQRRAAAREVSDRVRLAGYSADVASAYAAADVVLMPSLVESFGNVAVEALGVGRPLVATRVGGLPEIVTDGETGLLCRPGDTDDLVACVRRIADDEDLAGRLAAAGAASVRERFGMATFRAGFREALATAVRGTG